MVPRYDENGNRRPTLDVCLDIAGREWLWFLFVLIVGTPLLHLSDREWDSNLGIAFLVVYPSVLMLRFTAWAIRQTGPYRAGVEAAKTSWRNSAPKPPI
jgi:hypothetical protein